MKFLALAAALLLEQMWPLRRNHLLQLWFIRWANVLEHRCNAGEYRQGAAAWLIAVLPLLLVVWVVQFLLYSVHPVLAWAWNIAVLYLTMGFRQFSHYFTEILQCLRLGELDAARDYLGRWRGEPVADYTGEQVARVAIEQGLAGSHRHVLGPVAWFVVLGPAGALLYRCAVVLGDKWAERNDPELAVFGRFAGDALYWIDWIPARLTAASFAIVGNFEDAVYCWRTQARTWSGHAGIILASGAGALGVRLGDALPLSGGLQPRPELGMGDEADAGYLESTVGLIWRVLVLWMFLIFVVTVANSLG